MKPELKATVVERTERYVISGDEIEQLIKDGFMAATFLNGRAGSAQTVTFDFQFDCYSGPKVRVVVTTREVG